MTSQYAGPALEDGDADDGIPSIGGLSLGSKTNALSNKITSVLSASYVDSEIRNALGLLDARGTANSTETRRNLKFDAQREVISSNVAILDEFGQVAEQLKRVGAMIAKLNTTCDQMRRHIALAKSESTPMLEEASVLMAGKQESETKQAVLNAFTSHFIIKDEDLDVLTSSALSVNEQFFIVLGRVKRIHNDCEPLLGSENERLGLELMEQTSRNLDAGFKKLYNWVQRALKGLDFEDPQISGSVRHALRVLSERPTLFQNCLEFLAEAREQTLFNAFQMALSGAGDASTNAIEFSAHDLLRYMGDMLAWVHSTTVSETESLEGLFIADAEAISEGIKSGRASEPWLQDYTTAGATENEPGHPNNITFDGEKALKDLVSRGLSTISATLRERIELAVHQHDEVVLLFKAHNLLTFYHGLFTKLVGSNSALTTTIVRLQSTTQDRLYQVLASDTDSSWLSNPVEAPVRHKENLATLAALFAVKPAAEMPAEQLQHFVTYYMSPAKDYAQIIATASKDLDHGGYDEASLEQAMVVLIININFILKHKVEGAAYQNIMKARKHREILKSLQDALVNRVYDEMMTGSGVKALLGETIDPGVLTRLPDYADRLDDFLITQYAEVVGKLKPVDAMLEAEEEQHQVESMEESARNLFMEQLEKVFDVLEQQGPEYRALYPRTMDDVKDLIF